MDAQRLKITPGLTGLWVISAESLIDQNLPEIDPASVVGPVKSYRISEIGRYLLSPKPIRVLKPLVGCQIHHHASPGAPVAENLRRWLPGRKRGQVSENRIPPEVLFTSYPKQPPRMADPNLEGHFNQIEDLLRPYDPVLKRILRLDPARVFDLTGICEDSDGKRTTLTLQGDVAGKISYLAENLSKPVGVILNTAQISEGLFDMSGFDFTAYDARKSHRLLKINQSGTLKCGIQEPDGSIHNWTDAAKGIDYLQLLELSIRSNAKFRDSFYQCINGEAAALKLFFNPQCGIEYSALRPPETYKQVFKTCPIEVTSKNVVIDSLRRLQVGISFNYLLQSDSDGEKLCTTISVMHDIRALDPIKDIVPQVYAEINKRTSRSEAGRFYLLDAIKGFPNEK